MSDLILILKGLYKIVRRQIRILYFKVDAWLRVWIYSIRFINDGYFGIDKVGHFTLHAAIAYIGSLLGGSAWSVFAMDTVIDLQTEYRQDRQGIGFSLLDVLYGRSGCVIVLILVLRGII